MPRKLPFRWFPASNMWKAGSGLPTIAEAYNMTVSAMKSRIRTLAVIYPREFPSRAEAAPSLSLKDRLSTSLSATGIVKKRPTARHARGRVAMRRAG